MEADMRLASGPIPDGPFRFALHFTLIAPAAERSSPSADLLENCTR